MTDHRCPNCGSKELHWRKDWERYVCECGCVHRSDRVQAASPVASPVGEAREHGECAHMLLQVKELTYDEQRQTVNFLLHLCDALAESGREVDKWRGGHEEEKAARESAALRAEKYRVEVERLRQDFQRNASTWSRKMASQEREIARLRQTLARREREISDLGREVVRMWNLLNDTERLAASEPKEERS